MATPVITPQMKVPVMPGIDSLAAWMNRARRTAATRRFAAASATALENP